MRFCMITTFYPPWSFGGDAVLVQQLARALGDRGHEVHVVHCLDAFRALGGRAERAPAELSDGPNVTVHGLESRAGPLSPLATHQTGRPLFKARPIRRLLERGFDVIHFHNVSLIGGPAILRQGRGIKLYTLHEYWLVCPTHLLFRFGRTPCTRPTCFSCSIAQGRPPQWWRRTGLLDESLRHVDAFLSPSRFGVEMHRRLGGDVPLVHLPNFVPAADAATAIHEEPEEPFFLYVGRLEAAKGVQTLVPFFRRWDRATLLVAGAGSEEAHLKRLAAGSERVRFLGHVPAGRLRQLYRRAVALVVPSLTFELFPLVVLEAFREGTPVVARNLGSMPEIVAESGGGLTYDREDELAAALERLLAERSWRDELGRRAAQTQRALWSTEAHLERYFEIIEGIAARRGAQREERAGDPP
jgi:glycosyltransferase involved in cell wall biosynthesis